MKSKVAVISDIHSNADALALVLKDLIIKRVDVTIFLGDILTYGCQPLEVMNMLKKYKQENSVIFIKGNHDQFYFDLQSGFEISNYTIPKFVEESVNWTLKKISPLILKDSFVWYDNYSFGDLYFSHANLYKYGDWSYVEKPHDLFKTFYKLQKQNFFTGVFGHSHRHMFAGIKENILYEINEFNAQVNRLDNLIINAGSIGQPRGKGVGYVLLYINNHKLYKASFEKIEMNFSNSIDLIKKTKLSQETKKKLIDYLEI